MGQVPVSCESADPPDVLRFDPVAKTEAVVTAGGELVEPRDLGVDADGHLLVVDAGGGGDAKLIRVDPGNGGQMLVYRGGGWSRSTVRQSAVEEEGGARETLASLRPGWRAGVRHGGAALAPVAEPSRFPRESP
jgi:hypothetical protein